LRDSWSVKTKTTTKGREKEITKGGRVGGGGWVISKKEDKITIKKSFR